MNPAIRHIEGNAKQLQHDGPICDRTGMLTPRSAAIVKASRGMRLLQAKDCGGEEAHPNEFLDWVRSVAREQPAAGWVAGVVGVHPWEIAFMHPQLQAEIYGKDPDTWVASPYAPFGRAVPVDGGFLLSGDWPYSTGTDYCDWAILGGVVMSVENAGPNAEPGPADVRHFVLPRSDYEIVPDSWNVMGLAGTGSKNVRMQEVFVPDYRVVEARLVTNGAYAAERRPGNPLYAMRFGLMFSAAIAAGSLGIAEGLLRVQREYMEGRVSVTGTAAKTDPLHLHALAVAEADFAASQCHFTNMVHGLYQHVAAGHTISLAQALEFRRNQVRCVDRVFESIGPLFRYAGSAGIQTTNDVERWWRDLQTAVTHVCNVRDTVYVGWGIERFGGKPPPGFY